MLASLRNAAAQGRDQTPRMIPVIEWLERCGDAMADLRPTSEGRLSFQGEPVNRMAAFSARSAATEWAWVIHFFERKYAHSVFVIEDFEVAIGPEAQALLKGKVLDFVDGKIITSSSA